jgi:diguanylate cyclase (GGDEF)-like protein
MKKDLHRRSSAVRSRIATMLLAAVACMLPQTGPAASFAPLALEHLTTADGLPQSTVMVTLQDSRGFLWFGTEAGLVRHDGRELRRYAQVPQDPHSLPGQFIWDIVEDRSGDLLVVLKNGGLARWDHGTDRFSSWRHRPGDPRSLSSDEARAVRVDAAGHIWIAFSDAGIDVLDPVSGEIRNLRHDPADPGSLAHDDVATLLARDDGSMIVGTEAGLQRWDPAKARFVPWGRRADGSTPLQGLRVMALHADRSGSLWVGTLRNGLWRLDAEGLVLEHHVHGSDPTSLADDEVRAILEDAAGRLWVGTAGGLALLDRIRGGFTNYTHDPQDPASLRDSFVMSLYQDRSGLLWIGTRSGGVSRWNPRSWLLGLHRHAWLGTEPVNAFAEAPGDTLWIASLHAGLVRYDPARRERHAGNEQAVRPLGSAPVMSLANSADRTLWIGTLAQGLKSLDARGRVKAYPVLPGSSAGTSAAGIMSLLPARDGRLWIGTYGGGVNVLEPATGRFRQLPVGGADGIAGANVTAIAEDAADNLWLGSDGQGLTLLRPDGEVAARFRHDVTDPRSLPSDVVYAIAIDAAGSIWIGTEGGGLARVDGDLAQPGSLSFTRLGTATGVFDTIYGVVPGRVGELWLSGNAGLQRLNPRTGDLRTYREEHGLQGDEFAFGSHLRLADGRVAFGGSGGFNLFDPAALASPRTPPRIVLTGVSVGGVPRDTPRPAWQVDRVELGYLDNVVTLDFGVLDFASVRGNQLAYRLGDLSEGWIDVGAQQRITLTNLEAGDTTLELRASAPDSGGTSVPFRLTLNRDPPPWRSMPAYAAYAALLWIAVAARVNHQRRRIRRMQAESARFERLAYFDGLTGLANRQRCLEIAREMVEAAAAQPCEVAVISLDLQGLKRVNDAFGHQQGDEVLKIFAQRLLSVLAESRLPQGDLLAGRSGGDEFVIILKSVGAAPIARALAESCLQHFRVPIRHDGVDYHTSPGIGFAVYPHDAADADTLFNCADAAVYAARARGSGKVVAYSREISVRRYDSLDIETRLRKAVQQDLLSVVYQPKFRIGDLQIAGMEALMRWHDPDLGDVPPGRFIEIAENSGLILDLGQWMIRAVCRQQRIWLDRGIRLPVAVNCSGKELMHGDPVTIIERETTAAGVPPALIEVELTESTFVSDSDAVQDCLRRLRALGCRIALDDFGTGYSSFAYLTRFPPDRIKIDRSFVREVDRSEGGAAIAAAILSLAEALHMEVTAEGVERDEELQWLRAHACREVQGYLLARPMPTPELEARFLDALAAGDGGQDFVPEYRVGNY